MKANEFKKRRKALLQHIGKGNIGLIASANEQVRNRDVHYPFRQDSDFYYLTGFNEPNALAVFIPGRKQGEYILFCREFDEQKARWEGAHAGLAGATDVHGADDAFPIDDIDDILPGLLENKNKVFYPMGRDSELDQKLLEWIGHLRQQSRTGVSAPMELASLEQIVHELRLIKTAPEIKLMRNAAKISAEAHIKAMRACRPGVYEYQLEAEFIYHLKNNGLRSEAYPSIVAAGTNACVLHYTDNQARLEPEQLILIDAGGECDHYAADITRTFPVSGRFNDSQKALYQLVLDTQLAVIDLVRPGLPWQDLHELSVKILTKGLVDLGILSGKVGKLIKDEAYKPYYMHRIGHWLGMDVHDVGSYKVDDQWRILEPGMVLTVEPGLYIPAEDGNVEPRWRGIGIRIEDDVLVTQDGHEVLTELAPKSIAEIEQLMGD